jgi:hypothetical protein
VLSALDDWARVAGTLAMLGGAVVLSALGLGEDPLEDLDP